MQDLTKWIPQDDCWIAEVKERIGEAKLMEYYNRVYTMLQEMKRGEVFEIEENVHPNNYGLFVRCACTAIKELSQQKVYGWALKNKGATIVRDEILIL
jgi:hypothetical protein